MALLMPKSPGEMGADVVVGFSSKIEFQWGTEGLMLHFLLMNSIREISAMGGYWR